MSVQPIDKSKFVPIEDVLRSLDKLVGKEVGITGTLTVRGDTEECFLAKSLEEYIGRNCLALGSGRCITNYLFQTLPACGGAGVSYADTAYVIGKVTKCGSSYSLSDLRYCRVVRDEFDVTVPLPQRFVILDRDGTIIEEKNYLSDPSQVILLPNASQGLKQMLSLGLGLVVATNQSGIGRGYFDRATADRVHMRMLELLLLEGVKLDIDAIFVCPHVPDENCECRKPKTKLVQDAATKFGFLPAQSFMIGDKPCDIDLGKAVGATTFLVKTGYGATYAQKPDVQASYVVDDLKSAADVLKGIVSLI